MSATKTTRSNNFYLPESPFIQLRKMLHLNRHQAAALVGLSYSGYCAVEAGLRKELSPRVLRGLQELGLDPFEFEKRYQAFRVAATKDLQTRLQRAIREAGASENDLT